MERAILTERFHIINAKEKETEKLLDMYNHLDPYFTYYNQKNNPYGCNMKIEAGQVSLVPVIH